MKNTDSAAYKARKEAFVSNLSGSSLTDINLVTLTAPVAVLLWTVLQRQRSFFRPDNSVAILVDFFLNVCGILFAFTAYSSAPTLLIFFLAVPTVPLLLEAGLSSKPKAKAPSKQKQDAEKPIDAIPSGIPNRTFITHYRGAMMIATCMAILAVDFPIFPRRFAKVETWGTSLMDLGVGSFVFSAGVVSARQILKPSPTTPQSSSSSPRQPSLPKRLIYSLRHSIPLFILGLIRLYSVKGLDYAEHVTEYGVHWNFFFTLGLLPPFTEVADFLASLLTSTTSNTLLLSSRYDILAILVAFTYETILNNTDLLSYILISPRGPSLLSKNREGVFSFAGYFAIFLSGRGVGTRILPFHQASITNTNAKTKSPKTKNSQPTITTATAVLKKDQTHTLLTLLLSSTIYTLLFLLTTNYTLGLNLRVSRRLSNAPYTLWTAAFNTFQLFLFAAIESLGSFLPASSISSSPPSIISSSTESSVLKAYNRHGLPVFLAANLLTGLVNLSFNTLDATGAVAMGLLAGYAAVVTAVAVGMEWSGWKVRL